MERARVLLSWSSGKDSAWTYRVLRQQGAEVTALLTSFNSAVGRVAMHAVRRELVEAQAGRLGMPLWNVELPWPCSNAEYEERMGRVCQRAVAAGVTHVAFGDLFLRDIRAYRERQLQGTGLTPLFPLWELPTGELASEMLAGGLRARITCIDLKALTPSFAGREFDEQLIADLPAGADACGENGEFHTFVYDSPDFASAIAVQTGESVERDGFLYTDLISV